MSASAISLWGAVDQSGEGLVVFEGSRRAHPTCLCNPITCNAWHRRDLEPSGYRALHKCSSFPVMTQALLGRFRSCDQHHVPLCMFELYGLRRSKPLGLKLCKHIRCIFSRILISVIRLARVCDVRRHILSCPDASLQPLWDMNLGTFLFENMFQLSARDWVTQLETRRQFWSVTLRVLTLPLWNLLCSSSTQIEWENLMMWKKHAVFWFREQRCHGEHVITIIFI